jgi:hypothetical protein
MQPSHKQIKKQALIRELGMYLYIGFGPQREVASIVLPASCLAPQHTGAGWIKILSEGFFRGV